jgi:anti-anti-sigma regulatory factor
MTRISFTVVRLGGAALIWADRPLNGSIAPKLNQALTQLDADSATPIVVDLVRVSALDEDVTLVLAAAAVRAGRRGRGLELRLSRGRSATVANEAQLRMVLREAFPTDEAFPNAA